MEYLAEIETVNGTVRCLHRRELQRQPRPWPIFPEGRAGVPVTDPLVIETPSRYRWDGAAFVLRPLVPTRVLPLATFIDRFTFDEQIAFEVLQGMSPRARVWFRNLQTHGRDGVDLDDPMLVAGLGFMKQASLDPNTPAAARVWPDDLTADARIAAIRA